MSGVASFRFFNVAKRRWTMVMGGVLPGLYLLLGNVTQWSTWTPVLLYVGSAVVVFVTMLVAKHACRIDVDVGLDGLRVRYGAFAAGGSKTRDRFVPFASVRSLRFTEQKIELEEEGRPPEEWHAWMGHDGFRARVDEVRRLADASKTDAMPILVAPFDGEYRSSAYPKELLLRVVEDCTQSASSRVAAAAAIRADLDDEELARVRIAAKTTASAELRSELEQIMESESEPPVRPALRS